MPVWNCLKSPIMTTSSCSPMVWSNRCKTSFQRKTMKTHLGEEQSDLGKIEPLTSERTTSSRPSHEHLVATMVPNLAVTMISDRAPSQKKIEQAGNGPSRRYIRYGADLGRFRLVIFFELFLLKSPRLKNSKKTSKFQVFSSLMRKKIE